MRSIPQACFDDRVARAHQGALSAAEWPEFAAHLATCIDCRIAWRLMIDFEQSAAPAPGDERTLGRAVKLALAQSRPRRIRAFRAAVVAAATLVAVGAASGAIFLRARHPAVSADLSDSARSAGAKARRAAASSAAEPVAADKSAALPTTEPALAPPAPSSEAQPPVAGDLRSARPSRKAVGRATGVTLEAQPSVENASTLFARAVSEREQGQTSVAIATFRSLHRRFPRTPQAVLALVSLADLSLSTGDAATALVAFEKYLAAAPSGALLPEALMGKARALSALGRASEADAVWREIARRYPDSPYGGRRIGTRKGGDTP